MEDNFLAILVAEPKHNWRLEELIKLPSQTSRIAVTLQDWLIMDVKRLAAKYGTTTKRMQCALVYRGYERFVERYGRDIEEVAKVALDAEPSEVFQIPRFRIHPAIKTKVYVPQSLEEPIGHLSSASLIPRSAVVAAILMLGTGDETSFPEQRESYLKLLAEHMKLIVSYLGGGEKS